MTTRHFALLAIIALLTRPLIRAQEQAEKDPPTRTQMYENIEIMCRLFDVKVHSHYLPQITARLASSGQCAACHQVNRMMGMGSPAGPLHELAASGQLTESPLNGLARGSLMPRDHVHSLGLPPGTEGVYLKGQGVILTMTVPQSDQNPTSMSSEPDKKPTSDWERMRKQLRREEPADDDKKPPRRNQSLAEIILHVLADNGSHFAQLGEGESLTVVVTFRSPDRVAGTGALFPSPHMNPWLQESGTPMFPRDPAAAQERPAQSVLGRTSAQSAGGADKPKNSAEEYALLGDLHRKQGKANDALLAYRRALDLGFGDGRLSAAVLIKVAELLKEQNKDREALDILQKATELLKTAGEKDPQGSAEKGGSPLPSKLIVSAPRKLLDQVGAGKVSFEEFAKAASVELLTFAAPKK